MGNALKKVQSGEPLKIPTVTFNTFVDAPRNFHSRQQTDTRTGGLDFTNKPSNRMAND